MKEVYILINNRPGYDKYPIDGMFFETKEEAESWKSKCYPTSKTIIVQTLVNFEVPYSKD